MVTCNPRRTFVIRESAAQRHPLVAANVVESNRGVGTLWLEQRDLIFCGGGRSDSYG